MTTLLLWLGLSIIALVGVRWLLHRLFDSRDEAFRRRRAVASPPRLGGLLGSERNGMRKLPVNPEQGSPR